MYAHQSVEELMPSCGCSEVVTIFHETGHAMQALLTTQTDVTVSGINGIEQDAIEQPSQFLERWSAAIQVPGLHPVV